MRLLLALVFLGLALQVYGQTSSGVVAASSSGAVAASSGAVAASSSGAVAASSGAVAASSSGAVAASSGAVAGSSSIAVAASSGAVASSSGAVAASSGAVAASSSGAVVASSSGQSQSQSASHTGSPSNTYPQPPAPINLANICLHHIQAICPQWANPGGFNFDLFRFYYTAQGSGIVNKVTLSGFDTLVTGLNPATLYDTWIQGVDSHNGVWSANSTILTMTTDPADPKKDPTRDIQGFSCSKTTTVNNRVGALCTWTAALDTVRQINFKVHCVSTLREPNLIRKRVFGAAAAALTSEMFAVNRDVGTCTIKARFYYTRRPTARHVFVLNL